MPLRRRAVGVGLAILVWMSFDVAAPVMTGTFRGMCKQLGVDPSDL